jgi:hypothetical protein
MKHILTAVPESLIPDANQLAMVLGEGPADVHTFGHLFHQDADGSLYSVRTLWVPEPWASSVQAPLTRPAWDTDNLIDMDAAERAQGALVLSPEVIPASPAAIVALDGMSGDAAVEAMGLTVVTESE